RLPGGLPQLDVDGGLVGGGPGADGLVLQRLHGAELGASDDLVVVVPDGSGEFGGDLGVQVALGADRGREVDVVGGGEDAGDAGVGQHPVLLGEQFLGPDEGGEAAHPVGPLAVD